MQARGLLMVEHRVIDRMIAVMAERAGRIRHLEHFDPLFVDRAVDFIRTYADRTHHGKEEDILFRGLQARPLSPEVRRQMDELVQDHQWARQATRDLVEANNRYRSGDTGALSAIAETLQDLAEFYPKHIQKEDKVFFPAVRVYFTDEEDKAMMREFWEFDRRMIHEKYRAVVEELEQAEGPEPARGPMLDP